MSAHLGKLIEEEVGRAEADMVSMRSRGQTVLTASGALVTLLTGLLAVAIGRNPSLQLTSESKLVAIFALSAFVAATLFVLLLYFPTSANAADEDNLARLAKDQWNQEGFDQDVARFLVVYLRSLREVTTKLSRLLKLAIAFEVLGVGLTAVLAGTLL